MPAGRRGNPERNEQFRSINDQMKEFREYGTAMLIFGEGIMETRIIAPLVEYFKNVKDPLIERKKRYPLNELIIITIVACMSMAEGWEDGNVTVA
jgi:alpha-D-ribose 1-methylphosphonate 5-triphosphate synthase subunit PhnH